MFCIFAWFQATAAAGVTAAMTDKENPLIVNVDDITYTISDIPAIITLHERNLTSSKTQVLSHWDSEAQTPAWQYGYVTHGSTNGSNAVTTGLTDQQAAKLVPTAENSLCTYRVYEVRISSNSQLTAEEISSLGEQNITLTVGTEGTSERAIVWTALTPSNGFAEGYNSSSKTVTIHLPANWDGTYNMTGVSYDKDVLIAVEGAGYTDTTDVTAVTVKGTAE